MLSTALNLAVVSKTRLLHHTLLHSYAMQLASSVRVSPAVYSDVFPSEDIALCDLCSYDAEVWKWVKKWPMIATVLNLMCLQKMITHTCFVPWEQSSANKCSSLFKPVSCLHKNHRGSNSNKSLRLCGDWCRRGSSFWQLKCHVISKPVYFTVVCCTA